MDVGRMCLSGGVRRRVTAAPSAVSRASSASREVYSRHFSPRTHATHPTGISHSLPAASAATTRVAAPGAAAPPAAADPSAAAVGAATAAAASAMKASGTRPPFAPK